MGLRKLAVLSFRYPKAILVFWTMFLVLFGFYAPKLTTVLQDHGLLADGSYVKVQQILAEDFHVPKDPVILVFEKKQSVSQEQFQQYIASSMLQFKDMNGLLEVVSPLERAGMLEGDFAYALLSFRQHSYEMKPVLDEMHRRLSHHPAISVRMTGKSVVQADVNEASFKDLTQAERIGIPAAFLILWIAFGGVVSALLPIVIGVIGVTGTMGMMYLLGTRMELSNFVLNVIPMVGLALSIDYALMLVSRFREELECGPVEQALMTTMQTAGRSVMYSAAAVWLGLLGVLLIPLPMFSSVAMGAMLVLAVSVCLTLTLLPALLVVLRRAIHAESKPLSAFRTSTLWYVWPGYVLKRPIRMGLLALLLLLCCLLPLNKLEVAIPDASSLPQGKESRMAAEAYQAHFESPSEARIFIVAQGKGAHTLSKNDWLEAHTLTEQLKRDPGVLRIDSIFDRLHMSPEQLYLLAQQPRLKERYIQPFVHENRMLIQVTLEGGAASKPAMDWVRRWEREAAHQGIPILLGGEAKYQQEVFDVIFDNLHRVILFIVVSNFIVLYLAFRSVLIPLKTIAMNFLSIGAAFGLLVWIFREGHLGMEQGSIAIMIPVFIFGLVFGISMDYGVFLVSRIFERYQRTKDNHNAVLIGVASTSRIITSAAAIMVAVTVPFAFGEVAGVRQLGIGIASAILIDATVIRLILVPSLMKWLGDWNWWAPKRFK
ncbi:MMPL family transporter [Paenibacillus cremeus]|uniref:MMPL family transporter n=2 Tax=Paenibacillus cremeus TaxID=2163881 RepID=A0A559KAP6_9BACL|nr:MMPL family transporter [Paenibacillus cremeus]